MYDPRGTVQALFTNQRISGSGSYGTEYVEVYIRERNPDGVIESNSAGGLILEQPIVEDPVEVNIGGQKHRVNMEIPCLLWIRKKKGIKKPDEFMKNIIDSFQKTIRTNRNSIITDGDVEGFGNVTPTTSPTLETWKKTLTIKAYKFE
jgi:hypothetical protein